MNNSYRLLYLASLTKEAQASDKSEETSIEDIEKIKPLEETSTSQTAKPYDETFGNLSDIDRAEAEARAKRWISFKGQPGEQEPVVLDPEKATLFELYFGVKTQRGRVFTPATTILNFAIKPSIGASDRFRSGAFGIPKDMSRRLKVPDDVKSDFQGLKYITLPTKEFETKLIYDAPEILESVNGRVDHIRTLTWKPENNSWHVTSTHGGVKGDLIRSGAEIDDVQDTLDKIEKDLAKDIATYPKLHSAINDFVNKLSDIMKEHASKGRAIYSERGVGGKFRSMSLEEKREMDSAIKRAVYQITSNSLQSAIFSNVPIIGDEDKETVLQVERTLNPQTSYPEGRLGGPPQSMSRKKF